MLRIFAVALGLFLNSCSAGTSSAQQLSAPTADSLIRVQTAASKFHLIDIRTPGEFASGHLANAQLIDFYADDFSAKLAKLPRSDKILLYCRSGNRTSQALGIMKSMGFTDVQHIVGGIGAWNRAGLPIER